MESARAAAIPGMAVGAQAVAVVAEAAAAAEVNGDDTTRRVGWAAAACGCVPPAAAFGVACCGAPTGLRGNDGSVVALGAALPVEAALWGTCRWAVRAMAAAAGR